MKSNYRNKIRNKRDIELVQKGIDYAILMMQDVLVVALNKEGFGKERISRVNGYFNEVFSWYREMQLDDQEYADIKLKQAVESVMNRN